MTVPDSSRAEFLKAQAMEYGGRIAHTITLAQLAADERVQIYRAQLIGLLNDWYLPLLSDLLIEVGAEHLTAERQRIEERLAQGIERYGLTHEAGDLFIGLLQLYTVLYDATQLKHEVYAARLEQIERVMAASR